MNTVTEKEIEEVLRESSDRLTGLEILMYVFADRHE